MEFNEPFFSVIMPVYNAAPFLQRAIESILEQEYTNFELILVDDQSTDNSYDICKSYLKKCNGHLVIEAGDEEILLCHTL